MRPVLCAIPLLVAGSAVAGRGGLFPNGRAPIDVGGPAPSATECAACHPDEVANWRTSLHAQAWDDPVYQASFDAARMRPWCANCHTPLPEQQAALRDPSAPGAHLLGEGITCAVCHVRDGVLLAADEPTQQARDAHAIVAEPALRDPAFCAGCHQFDNPVDDVLPVKYTREPLQDTYGEWARSGHASTCQDCHLADHAFRGAHDDDLVRSVLTVDVRAAAGGETGPIARITVGDTAHDVPTGDPFRRLILRACADEACEQVLSHTLFARWFEPTKRSWTEVQDTRLHAGETREVPLPAGTVAWELSYAFSEPGVDEHVPAELRAHRILWGSVR